MGETTSTTTHRRRLRGIVVRAALPKTVTVRVERLFRHPRVQRVVRRSRKFLVDDAQDAAHVGDSVVIEETRPLSRHKRWRIVEVVQRVQVSEADESLAMSD